MPSSTNTRGEPSADVEFFYSFAPVFEVDNSLFRIPEHVIRESKTFCDILYATQEPEREAPQVLAGITADEFRDFLRVLLACPYPVRGHNAHQKPTSWLSVMKVASLYGFPSVRDVAIERIQRKEDCVVRLAAARQYDVPALLPHALDDVLNRDRPVSLAEAEVLGFELALNVMTYREEWMRRSPGNSADRVTVEEEKMRYVERIFGEGFARDVKTGRDMKDGSTRTSAAP